MKRFLGLAILMAGFGVAPAADLFKSHHQPTNEPCEPGYQWVEETCYKEVERYVCKMVPDVKKIKKWVYSAKDDPFCLHHEGHGHGHHGTCNDPNCPTCKGPYCRIQLVKREIVCEEPTTKCVVEKVVEQVPYTVKKKVLIETGYGSSVPATSAPPVIAAPPPPAQVNPLPSPPPPPPAQVNPLPSPPPPPPPAKLPKASAPLVPEIAPLPMANVTPPPALPLPVSTPSTPFVLLPVAPEATPAQPLSARVVPLPPLPPVAPVPFAPLPQN